MTEPLRPMSTGQVLDHTFALYRKNFLLFVGIATVGPAAGVIFQLLTVGANVTSPFGARMAAGTKLGIGTGLAAVASVVVGYLIMLAGMAISHAATVKAVAAVHLGRETSIAGAYKALSGRIWSLFGTCLLILLLMVVAVIGVTIAMVPVFMGIGMLGRTGSGPVAAIIGGLVALVIVALLFVAIIAIYVRYAFAIQACVVENLRPRASLKRSVFLSKGSRPRVIAIYFVFLLLSGILGFGLNALAVGAGSVLHNKIVAAVVVYLAGFIAGSLTGPLATIGISLLYYDERVRKEAFDLQLMLSSLDAPAVPMGIPAQV
jgi:hypothetical protein